MDILDAAQKLTDAGYPTQVITDGDTTHATATLPSGAQLNIVRNAPTDKPGQFLIELIIENVDYIADTSGTIDDVLRYAATATKRVDTMSDGDVFSLDGGANWLVCAVPLFGNVAVYLPGQTVGNDNAATVRVDAARDDCALIGATLPAGTTVPVDIDPNTL